MNLRGALALLVVSPLAAAWAVVDPPVVSASVDRDEITVGDRILLSIEVTHDPRVRIVTPLQNLGAWLQHFQVKDIRERKGLRAPEDKRAIGMEFELSTYTSGDYPIPPIAVAYAMPDGATGVVYTDAMTIHVKSVLPADDTNYVLRDIRPPVVAPSSGVVQRLIMIGLLSAIALAGLVYALIWWLRRSPLQAIPPDPPHVVALRRIQALRRDNGYRAGEARAFAIELSDLLRRYLGDAWQYNAIDLTTAELAESFEVYAIPSAWHERLLIVLRACDRVKFADWPMSQDEMSAHLDMVEAFVRATIPSPDTPKSAAAEPAEVGHG